MGPKGKGWKYVFGWHGPKLAERYYRNKDLGIERLLQTKCVGGVWQEGVWFEKKVSEKEWEKLEERSE